MMLSFSDPGPYAARIRKAGVPLICQVHTLDHAFHAVDIGADVVVAQGTEAGGHGWALRSTMPFVPSVVDALAARAPDVLVLAAGGIGDGRGLAASLMLGADGVLMGTRFWATQESLRRTAVYGPVRTVVCRKGCRCRLRRIGGARSQDRKATAELRDFDLIDLDGNQLTFGMGSAA
jgi:hypothetical protein